MQESTGYTSYMSSHFGLHPEHMNRSHVLVIKRMVLAFANSGTSSYSDERRILPLSIYHPLGRRRRLLFATIIFVLENDSASLDEGVCRRAATILISV